MRSPYVQLPKHDVSPFFLLKHDVRYLHGNDTMSTFSTNGEEIPFNTREYRVRTDDDLVFVRKVYYINSDDLPPVMEGRVYVVSKMLAYVCDGLRTDFAYPGTHPLYDRAKFLDSQIEAIKRFRLPDKLVLLPSKKV